MTIEEFSQELDEVRRQLDKLAEEYRTLTELIQQLEAQRKEIAQQIVEIWQKTSLKPSQYATVVSGRTSYDQQRLIAYLKSKGLRDAIVVEEKVDTRRLKELLAEGRLTQQELEPFQVKGRPYVQLIKEDRSNA